MITVRDVWSVLLLERAANSLAYSGFGEGSDGTEVKVLKASTASLVGVGDGIKVQEVCALCHSVRLRYSTRQELLWKQWLLVYLDDQAFTATLSNMVGVLITATTHGLSRKTMSQSSLKRYASVYIRQTCFNQAAYLVHGLIHTSRVIRLKRICQCQTINKKPQPND
jgi:hypothetical protein